MDAKARKMPRRRDEKLLAAVITDRIKGYKKFSTEAKTAFAQAVSRELPFAERFANNLPESIEWIDRLAPASVKVLAALTEFSTLYYGSENLAITSLRALQGDKVHNNTRITDVTSYFLTLSNGLTEMLKYKNKPGQPNTKELLITITIAKNYNAYFKELPTLGKGKKIWLDDGISVRHDSMFDVVCNAVEQGYDIRISHETRRDAKRYVEKSG